MYSLKTICGSRSMEQFQGKLFIFKIYIVNLFFTNYVYLLNSMVLPPSYICSMPALILNNMGLPLLIFVICMHQLKIWFYPLLIFVLCRHQSVMNLNDTLLTYIIRTLRVKKRKQWQGINNLFLVKLNNTMYFNGSLDLLHILGSG